MDSSCSVISRLISDGLVSRGPCTSRNTADDAILICWSEISVAGRDGWAPWRWRRADGHGSTRPYTSGATKRSGT
eukprot:7399088-Pyramimonas_sp.AAC.1